MKLSPVVFKFQELFSSWRYYLYITPPRSLRGVTPGTSQRIHLQSTIPLRLLLAPCEPEYIPLGYPQYSTPRASEAFRLENAYKIEIWRWRQQSRVPGRVVVDYQESLVDTRYWWIGISTGRERIEITPVNNIISLFDYPDILAGIVVKDALGASVNYTVKDQSTSRAERFKAEIQLPNNNPVVVEYDTPVVPVEVSYTDNIEVNEQWNRIY